MEQKCSTTFLTCKLMVHGLNAIRVWIRAVDIDEQSETVSRSQQFVLNWGCMEEMRCQATHLFKAMLSVIPYSIGYHVFPHDLIKGLYWSPSEYIAL